jgi:hypothetical protein
MWAVDVDELGSILKKETLWIGTKFKDFRLVAAV